MNIRPYIHVKGAYIHEHELVNDVYYKFVRELTFMNARLTFMNVSPFIHRLTLTRLPNFEVSRALDKGTLSKISCDCHTFNIISRKT